MSIIDANGNTIANATTDITGFYYMATTGVLGPGATYTLQVNNVPAGFASVSPTNQPFVWQGVELAFANFVLNWWHSSPTSEVVSPMTQFSFVFRL